MYQRGKLEFFTIMLYHIILRIIQSIGISSINYPLVYLILVKILLLCRLNFCRFVPSLSYIETIISTQRTQAPNPKVSYAAHLPK